MATISSSLASLPVHGEMSHPVNNEPKKSIFHHTFNSVYGHYSDQLKVFTAERYQKIPALNFDTAKGSLFNSGTLTLILEIFKDAYSVDNKRFQHTQIVTQIRNLIKAKEKGLTDELELEAAKMIDEISLWRNTQADLMPTYVEFLTQLAPESMNDESLKAKPLDQLFDEIFNLLENNKSFTGSIEKNRDPLLQGYLPTALFKAFSTQFFLTPRCTIENKDKTEIEINVELTNLLGTLKERKETLVYFNLIERAPNDGLTDPEGSHHALTAAIEQLAELEKFKDLITMVTLDRDSDFYWQTGEYENQLISVEEFKRDFFQHLYSENPKTSQYKLPLQFNDQMKALLDQIQREYFPKEEILNDQARKSFIDITQAKIVQGVVETIKPIYTNVSCRFSLDRAPTLLALVFVLAKLEAKEEVGIEEKKQLLALILVPALIAHNRLAIKKRFDRLYEAYLRMQKRETMSKPETPLKQVSDHSKE